MPELTVRRVIHAPSDRVWDLIAAVESYPKLMEPVRAITILEQSPDELTVRWEIELHGLVLTWTQHERHDRAALRIEFSQLDGDLAAFEGFWQLRKSGEDHTEAELFVRFDLGMPELERMLNPIATQALHESAEKMLGALGGEP